MAEACEAHDGVALAVIARALAQEIGQVSGEAAAGRCRLLTAINGKLTTLGLAMIELSHPDAGETDTDLLDLIEASIDNDRLCAHTRNFLQMALSRLERFDGDPLPISEHAGA